MLSRSVPSERSVLLADLELSRVTAMKADQNAAAQAPTAPLGEGKLEAPQGEAPPAA